MLRTVFLTFLTLLIAIGGGSASVVYMLDRAAGVGALTVGGWTAYPNYGTEDADPYSKARLAREPELPLGRAEGLSFVAQRDAANRPLRRECSYRVEGAVPPSRFWTLHAVDASHNVIGANRRRAASLHSYQILRRRDETFEITADRHPAPGNWLALAGSGAVRFVLTLYDAPAASTANVAAAQLPRIERIGCDG